MSPIPKTPDPSDSFPKNPVSLAVDTASVSVVIVDPVAGTDTNGWVYNSVTGQFWADSPDSGPSGVLYFLL